MDLTTTTSPTVATPRSGKRFFVNEIFLSLQGEGVRAGTANIFVRFGGCNLKCSGEWVGNKETGVFQPLCDTEFESGRRLSPEEIHKWFLECSEKIKFVILTGGEPGLQVDKEFCDYFHELGYKLAIETNGTIALPEGLDWITLSPKVAEHALKQLFAHELKYVRAYGQGIPKTAVTAEYYVISPAFEGDYLDPKTLAWCVQLCKDHPQWRLSLQLHKILGVR